MRRFAPVQLVADGGGDPPHAWVRYNNSFGSGDGLPPSAGDGSDPAAALGLVADGLQDAVMESLSAVCPRHDLGAHPRAIGGQAVWRCEGAGDHYIAVIGAWR